MNPFRFFILLFCFIAFSACEKDELQEEMSILVGTWKWTETYRVNNYCDTDSLWNYLLIDSAKEGNCFALEFVERGRVIYYFNDAVLWNERVVFESKNIIGNGSYEYHFVILLNNKYNNRMDVWVGQDSLLLNDFPKDTEVHCSEVFNHFIRQ